MKRRKGAGMAGMVLSFARGAKLFFAAAVVSAAVSILFNFIMPQVVGFTVDSVIGGQEKTLMSVFERLVAALGGVQGLRDHIILCAAGVVACALISALFNFLSRTSIAKGTETFTRNLRGTLFSHVQYLPFAWHTEHQTGDIIQRCTSDVETMRRFISEQLIDVLRTVILLVIAESIMFSMNTAMAIVVTAFIPLIFMYTAFFFGRISKKFLICDEAEGELMTKVQENLTGVRVVRAFGREKYEMETFDDKNDTYAAKWQNLGYTLGVYWGVGDIVSASQLLAVVTFGTYFAATGRITLGELLVFISYTMTIGWPVRQMGRVLSEMSKTGVSLKRIKEILDSPAEKDSPDAAKPPLDRDIEFSHVSFSYGGQEVLKDVSFTVKSGTTFGILGATGSGKSTITYLLNRLYDLPEDGGAITIGGVDIRDMDRRWLRGGVGLVLQEPFLFSKTIFENIDIAARSGDRDLVRRRASIADVDRDIMEFSQGYDTVVGERGVTLSGGQKQRVAMARTLMLGAPVMVFDDSMSNLDMETDARIRDALRENTSDATVILISHRISTLMHADMIMVLEDGRVAEIGTHEQLLRSGGAYRRTYDIQSGHSEGVAE